VSLELEQLVQAMQAQTAAISALVESNQQVIALLTDVVAYVADDVESPGDVDAVGTLD
jgi:hypothetical protein